MGKYKLLSYFINKGLSFAINSAGKVKTSMNNSKYNEYSPLLLFLKFCIFLLFVFNIIYFIFCQSLFEDLQKS